MLLTVCTIRQLPQAITLGKSWQHHHPDQPFIIGLADDPQQIPAGFTVPFPLLTVDHCLPADLARLSVKYTPVEFVAACKPSFIQAAFAQYPGDKLLYADPSTYIYAPLTTSLDQLATATILLTPFWTRPPLPHTRPDEKYLQNIGLYSAGSIGFRRSAETDRMLAWWQERVLDRAQIDFCEGLCMDQIWLMHVPVFFEGVAVLTDASWQLARWNLPERILKQEETGWLAAKNNPGSPALFAPLLTANFLGLLNPDEGFFPYQTPFSLAQFPPLDQLLTQYKQALAPNRWSGLEQRQPTYGQRSIAPILRGWQQRAITSLRYVIKFIDTVSY